MNAIVNTGPGRLEWSDWPTPDPGPGQVRIRTRAVGICATDLEMIAGWERTGFPSIPGHEWSGVVDATGPGVDPSLAGTPCVAENVWADGGEVGFEHPGGYGACFVTEAARVQTLDAGTPAHVAVLIEPLAVCVRGLRRLCPGGGPAAEPILVFGDGPIGLLTTLLLASAGARDLTVIGGRDRRLALARDFGARQALNYHPYGDGLAEAIRRASGAAFATIVEATGSPRAMPASMELAAAGADILVLGDYAGGQAAFRWNQLLHKELRLIGSNASAQAWPEATRLGMALRAQLEQMVTHRFAAHDFAAAFQLVRSRDPGVIKVVLEW
jgi:2-desacetyl-2-hydroxyethyl bacteriochlorophyllide A dehydrogenase